MSNETTSVKKPRCIPQNLSMSESAPVCQPWSYAGPHAMADMLTDRYFLSCHDRLRPGDTIRIVQMKDANIHARDNEVIAFANVTIIKVGKVSIDMTVDSLVIMGEKPSEEKAGTEFIGEKPSGPGVGQETIDVINETIAAMQETIKRLQDEGSGVTDEDIKERIQGLLEGETFKDMTTNIEQLSEAVLEIQESVTNAPTEIKEEDQDIDGSIPYHKWNPGKGEHQAVTGEGDDLKVLFSHKDKAKVKSFLDKQ